MKALLIFLLIAAADANQVRLGWDANPADQQIQGYRLRSNNVLLATTTATELLVLLPNVETYTPVTVSAYNVTAEGPQSSPLYIPPPQVQVQRSADLLTWFPVATIDFRNTQILRVRLGAGNPPTATVEQSYTGGVTWVFVATLPPAPTQFVRLATPP